MGIPYLHVGGECVAAPRSYWLPVLSVFLHKGGNAFTWKPTAASGVKEARANHYEAAAGEWVVVDGWSTAAQWDRLLSKRLYKCVYDLCGFAAQSSA